MKNAKTKAIVSLAVVLAVTIAAGWLGLTGMPLPPNGLYKLLPWLPTTDAANWPEVLPLGLDLRGGVYVEYSAEKPEGEADFNSLIEGTMAVITTRLSDKGYSESTVQKLGEDGIRVEIPDVTDPNAILELIGEPALLEFKTPDGETFMTGDMVATAVPAYNEMGEAVINFKLNAEGTEIFKNMTSAHIGQALSIYLDGELLLNPTVNETIPTGEGQISGMGTIEDAQTIASQIQSGALPLVLTQQKVDTVSATLGDDALSTSVLAACVGIVLIMALLIVRYRMNGVLASWALVIYIITLFFAIAVIPGIQLTLPGIAGIVLGIGMAVDANVIIFERFNEEIRSGRSLKAAVRVGFRNAWSAILDANVTTLIAAGVLFAYGTGSIQGFGITLGLSVLVSMFTAVAVTRFLMKNVVAIKDWNVRAFTSGVQTAKEGK
ncbi:MAG: protein translocase subunit SecD [Clostridia bacterium]|nr:protein translocase subunit SecD [Clostridia bacterium]